MAGSVIAYKPLRVALRGDGHVLVLFRRTRCPDVRGVGLCAAPGTHMCMAVHTRDELTVVHGDMSVTRHFKAGVPVTLQPTALLAVQLADALRHTHAQMRDAMDGICGASDTLSGWNSELEALGAAWLRAAVMNADPVVAGAPLCTDTHADTPTAALVRAHALSLPPASESRVFLDVTPSGTVASAIDAGIVAYLTPRHLSHAAVHTCTRSCGQPCAYSGVRVRGWAWHAHTVTRVLSVDRGSASRVHVVGSELQMCRFVVAQDAIWTADVCVGHASEACARRDAACLALLKLFDAATAGAVPSRACSCDMGEPAHIDAVWGGLHRPLPLRYVPAHVLDGALLSASVTARVLHRHASMHRRQLPSISSTPRAESADPPMSAGSSPIHLAPHPTDARNALVARVLRENAVLVDRLQWSLL